ncbi:MAG: response regulator [Candidatus Aminicenantes bacterium]|nr:MAG: response regulator [Candidatus Aminicenantes bacterium]
MVTKKEKLKRPPQTADPLLQLHKELENNLKGVRQHKTKIEELTKATIDELKRLQDLSKKAKKIQPKNKQNNSTTSHNNNHKFELDYELTNLKMIKKILSLATPFETKQTTPKKKTKTRKKRDVLQAKDRSKTKKKEKNRITKVLIVEDDRTTIKIVTHILEQHSFEVGFATDAEDGLKKAFKAKPDIILLDIMLPGMDGFQLLAKLQASEDMSRIPVVILSSLSGEKDILKGLEKGATDYILKPFSPQILLYKIKKIMSLKNEHLASNRHI